MRRLAVNLPTEGLQVRPPGVPGDVRVASAPVVETDTTLQSGRRGLLVLADASDAPRDIELVGERTLSTTHLQSAGRSAVVNQ